jgi:hypothetical protein
MQVDRNWDLFVIPRIYLPRAIKKAGTMAALLTSAPQFMNPENREGAIVLPHGLNNYVDDKAF